MSDTEKTHWAVADRAAVEEYMSNTPNVPHFSAVELVAAWERSRSEGDDEVSRRYPTWSPEQLRSITRFSNSFFYSMDAFARGIARRITMDSPAELAVFLSLIARYEWANNGHTRTVPEAERERCFLSILQAMAANDITVAELFAASALAAPARKPGAREYAPVTAGVVALLLRNGGRPNPDCIPVPGVKGIANVGVGSLFHLQPSKPGMDELSYEIKRCERILPAGHLPIAGGSDLFTLSLQSRTFGAVYWWFHETEDVDDDGNFLESAGYLLAGSFDEFLTRIALLFGDDEEPEVAGTSQRGGSRKIPRATIKRLLRLMSHDLTPEKVKEVEQAVKELRDLSGIQDGEWPFINLRNPRVLHCLLEAGLNPEMTDTDGHSLLWQCASSRECIDLLVERGVKIDRRSGGENETALMRAIDAEDIAAVKRLLQLGANPTVRLSWPIQHKLDDNAKLRKLIERARGEWRANKEKKGHSQPAAAKSKAVAPKSKTSKSQPTIKRLLQLMKHDYLTDEDEAVEGIEELVEELGDLSGIRDGQWPSIDKFESPRLLSCLLEAGLNPDILDKAGNSLLRQCVVHPECIDLLVERGVDVDRRSGRNKETALMRATYMGDEECVQRLLDAGANPTLEFSIDAKLMLEMDDDMTAVIEAARDAWKRNKQGKRVKKKKK